MGPLPEGTNVELMSDFCKKVGEMRGEHAGRQEAHWCEYLILQSQINHFCSTSPLLQHHPPSPSTKSHKREFGRNRTN